MIIILNPPCLVHRYVLCVIFLSFCPATANVYYFSLLLCFIIFRLKVILLVFLNTEKDFVLSLPPGLLPTGQDLNGHWNDKVLATLSVTPCILQPYGMHGCKQRLQSYTVSLSNVQNNSEIGF